MRHAQRAVCQPGVQHECRLRSANGGAGHGETEKRPSLPPNSGLNVTSRPLLSAVTLDRYFSVTRIRGEAPAVTSRPLRLCRYSYVAKRPLLLGAYFSAR